MADKTVVIPQHSLKPLKIVKWKVNEGNSISIGCVMLLYKVDADDNKETLKLKSSKAGTVHRIVAQEGDVVKFGEPLLELQACIHPTVMKDMCAECGADLRKDDSVTTASVPMIHSVPELKVSLELAKKLGKADSDRLLKDRKLVLLVDLDQTLIHTTNDNIPANLKDVYHFQLYGAHSPWYHTRLRPGTHKFLTNMSSLYELHICTFGARNYAHMIAMFLDQDGQLFSHRILSRDECFNSNSKTANLKALFPCGDNMVCIIDDREDVWSYASNLIHVKPYHFFQHTGDINAPPGLDKHEDDDKEGIDLTKVQPKSKIIKVNGSSVEETLQVEEDTEITNSENQNNLEENNEKIILNTDNKKKETNSGTTERTLNTEGNLKSKSTKKIKKTTEIKNNSTDIENKCTDIVNKSTGVENISNETGSKSTIVVKSTTAVDDKFSKVENKFIGIVNTLTEVDNKSTEEKNKSTEVENKSTESENKSTELENKSTEVENKSIEVANKSTEVENKSTEVDNKSTEVADKSTEVENKSTEVENKSTEVKNKSTEVENKSTEVENKSTEVENKSIDVENKSTEVENKSTEVENKSTEVDNKSTEVADKSTEVKNKSIDVENKSTEVENKSTEVENKSIEVENKSTEVENKFTEVADKSTEVENKSTEVENKFTEVADKSTEVENKSIEVENKSTEVENKSTEVDNKSTGVENKSIDVENKSTEFVKKSTEIETTEVKNKSTEVENKPIEIENKSTEVEKKFIEVKVVKKSTEIENISTKVENKSTEIQKKKIDKENKFTDAEKKSIEVKKKFIKVVKKSTAVEKLTSVESNVENKITKIKDIPNEKLKKPIEMENCTVAEKKTFEVENKSTDLKKQSTILQKKSTIMENKTIVDDDMVENRIENKKETETIVNKNKEAIINDDIMIETKAINQGEKEIIIDIESSDKVQNCDEEKIDKISVKNVSLKSFKNNDKVINIADKNEMEVGKEEMETVMDKIEVKEKMEVVENEVVVVSDKMEVRDFEIQKQEEVDTRREIIKDEGIEDAAIVTEGMQVREDQIKNIEGRREDELIEIDDPDDYLTYLEEILRIIHHAFYENYDKLESGEVPDLKKVIPEVRSNILKGTKLVFSGLVPTHIKLEQSKAYQVARSLGAIVTQDLEENSTHLVAVRPGTAKVNVGRRKKTLKIVTPDWLWSCAERWERVEEKLYPLNNKGSKNRHPPPHCSSPEHIVNFDITQPAIIRKRTPSGRFMDTINPLMSFSSADIADMDREVEDIFNESESEGESSHKRTAIEVDNDELILKKLKPSKDTEDESSSSDESLTGEHPHGWNPNSNSRKRSRVDQEIEDESTADEFPSTKFRRGEELSSDLEFGQESNSEGSVDAPDEIDDGDWNMMGAALEREFLSNN